METYNRATGFCYDHAPESIAAGDGSSGILDIFVHYARNIHNICIYDNQDVYAKFSLTCSPDETLSTTIIAGGGKNPEFNESLRMEISHRDAVLKCEIWMLSRARNFLEDQLLGFVLVPLSPLAGKGKRTQDFTLSSTDLFHSPAGTVKLTLFLATSPSLDSFSEPTKSSISSEVVLLDRKGPDDTDAMDQYGRIEFPDINIVTENHKMVCEYFNIARGKSASKTLVMEPASFLHLGGLVQPMEDYEMALNSSEDNSDRSVSPNESFQNSGVSGSTTTSLSDDRNSGDSLERKNHHGTKNLSNSLAEPHENPEASPDTPTSKTGNVPPDVNKGSNYPSKADETAKQGNMKSVELGTVFTAPHGNINIEAEPSAMQQQIVDMYMRSMQQFTESLAKMKLPMDLENPESNDNNRGVIQAPGARSDEEKRKDGSKVFYGSRAFF